MLGLLIVQKKKKKKKKKKVGGYKAAMLWEQKIRKQVQRKKYTIA